MKLGSEIRWLSEVDVASLLTMKESIEAVERAFAAQGRQEVQQPAKNYLNFDPFGGDLRTMPAYLKSPWNAAGVKIVNSNPKNPEKNLPAVTGIMTVLDPETGLPKAIMAAGTLTSYRTGAAGGVAAKYLARADSSVVGLVGCGHQAETQLSALLNFFDLSNALVWGKTLQEAETFCSMSQCKNRVKLVPCSELQEACQADILVTTTPVRHPLIKADWVRHGTHINAIGADAPGKQELETALLKKARVFVDEWEQSSHGGEINVASTKGEYTKDDIAGELGALIAHKISGRQSPADITIFDSTGLAIQDVAVADLVVQKAENYHKGQVLQFHG